jgi:hypothetical protein
MNFQNYWIIFQLKNRWNRSTAADPWVHGNFIKPGPSIWWFVAWIKWAEGVSGLLIWVVSFGLDDAGTSSSSVRSAETELGRHHGRWFGRSYASATVHETKQGFFLPDLGYERNSFCELTVVKMDHGEPATGRRLGQSSMAEGTVSNGAPALRTPLAVMVLVGGSSSKHQIGMGGSNVATRRRWRGSAMVARVWAKFARDRELFIGVLVPIRRRQKS